MVKSCGPDKACKLSHTSVSGQHYLDVTYTAVGAITYGQFFVFRVLILSLLQSSDLIKAHIYLLLIIIGSYTFHEITVSLQCGLVSLN